MCTKERLRSRDDEQEMTGNDERRDTERESHVEAGGGVRALVEVQAIAGTRNTEQRIAIQEKRVILVTMRHELYKCRA